MAGSPSVVLDGHLQGLAAHDRAVHLLLGQAAQVVGDILVGDLAASSRVMPLIISVRAEAEAMALAQPKVWNLASVMRLFSSSLKVSFRASPQAMEPTSADAVRVLDLPYVPGLRKWSLTLSVYSHILSPLLRIHGH